MKLYFSFTDIKWYLLLFCSFFIGTESRGGGAVCFTFDDYSGENWLKADAIFKKYNARVTFFVVGPITAEKAEVMKKLQDAGHSIGLHSIRHCNADPMPEGWDIKTYFEKEVEPQLEACRKYNIRIDGFAYPNNRRTEATDRELFKYFKYLRAGEGKARKPRFYGAGDIKENMVLGGSGIGAYYKSDVNVLKKRLKRAAMENKMLVFFSHNIYPGAGHVHMDSAMLEELLKCASEQGMKIISIKEIPQLKLK